MMRTQGIPQLHSSSSSLYVQKWQIIYEIRFFKMGYILEKKVSTSSHSTEEIAISAKRRKISVDPQDLELPDHSSDSSLSTDSILKIHDIYLDFESAECDIPFPEGNQKMRMDDERYDETDKTSFSKDVSKFIIILSEKQEI